MPRDRVPKLVGADVELGNVILGAGDGVMTGAAASRALLREIEAPYADVLGAAFTEHEQDWGRRHLASNGGCVYVDLDHLECCVPEVVSAFDHVAAWHAMLRIARDAQRRANCRLPAGRTIQVLVNNSDGQGHAWGSHLNVLLTRRAWDDLFERRLHHLVWLASFQASSIVFTGQGKVGAENGRPWAPYQLSQRADFFEVLTGTQTTRRRPIVNSRDEPLCGQGRGEADELARLHCIFFDSTLCHGSTLLRVGTMQLVTAMLEAGAVDARLILEDPVSAVVAWSHDPTLGTRARTVSGRRLTAVELQLLFLGRARRFAATGGFDDVVPRAGEILDLWEDTLTRLRIGDVTGLAGRLDWMLKFRILQRALLQRPDLGWASPEIKYLDHLYASLDLDEGLYWAHERLGITESRVSEKDIVRFTHEPPDDTRAFTRAMLLRRAGAFGVLEVDWDRVRLWPSLRTVHLGDPLGSTRADHEHVLRPGATMDAILEALTHQNGRSPCESGNGAPTSP